MPGYMHSQYSPILVSYAPYAPMIELQRTPLRSIHLAYCICRTLAILSSSGNSSVCSNVFLLRVSENIYSILHRIFRLSSFASRPVLYPSEGNITTECDLLSSRAGRAFRQTLLPVHQ